MRNPIEAVRPGVHRSWFNPRIFMRRVISSVVCVTLLIATMPAPLWAQEAPPADSGSAQFYAPEQLDAILAPIALYPDQLLTQVLMASAFPLDVVAAARWVQVPGNKDLTGDALAAALAHQSWDPSVKSLVPFPQVLVMMDANLDWLQQLGYAMGEQESAVMDSIQRLRKQAQIAGQLKSTDQQLVRTEGQAIVIAPAQPSVVYVPVYNPSVVYGTWGYPAYPPVYLPPPPAYYAGPAVVAGLYFGDGVAISASLWGWARPNWGSRNVYINVNHYNIINVNRPPIRNPNWRPPPPKGGYRPPPGPVGPPVRPPGGKPPGGQPGKPPGGRPGKPPGGQPGKPPGGQPGKPPGGQPGKPPGGQPGKPPGGQPGKPPGGQPGKPPGGQPGKPPGGQPGKPPGGQPGKPPGGQPSKPPGGQPGKPPGGQPGKPPGMPPGGQASPGTKQGKPGPQNDN